LQLVEERLESILLEGEECLAGFLLGGEDAVDVGNLQYRWVGGQVVIVKVRLASEKEGAEVVAARYGGSAGGALGGSWRAAGNARQKEERVGWRGVWGVGTFLARGFSERTWYPFLNASIVASTCRGDGKELTTMSKPPASSILRQSS
jgi:hypothetical protein